MKENGEKINTLGMVGKFFIFFKIIKVFVFYFKGYIIILMEQNMKENGEMTVQMEKVFNIFVISFLLFSYSKVLYIILMDL